MGFFSFLFKNKKNVDFDISTEVYAFDEMITEAFPPVNKYRVNPSGKRYDDTYITGINYKLRELLLLVWWGRTKSPRKTTSKPPRYFFYDYHLETKKVTDKFIQDGLLVRNNENKVVLTDLGQKIYNEYEKLWEIHSYKGFLGELPNLDAVFEKWDYKQYKANNNLLEVRHLQAIIEYNTNMRNRFRYNSNEYNAYQQDINQDKEQIQFLLEEYDQLIK